MCDASIDVFLDVNFKSNFREDLKRHIHESSSIEFRSSTLLLQVPKLLLCKLQFLTLSSRDGLNLSGFQTGMKESSNFLLLRLRDTSVNWMSCSNGGGIAFVLVVSD